MEIIQQTAERINSLFWNNSFWLPEPVTWDDLRNDPDGPQAHVNHAQARQLLAIFPIAVLLTIVRLLVEHFVFLPIGRHYKLRNGKVVMPENVGKLHAYYKKAKRPLSSELDNLANELSWSRRQVERWFRQRRNCDKSSEMKKFCETGWRFSFYTTLHIYGIYVLYDEDFTFDLNELWNGWPHHDTKEQFYWYYVIELGFYVALIFSLLNDVKRKDFREMTIHHIVTIVVMAYSWSVNFVRVGVVILFTHDIVDYWLEAAKLLKYLRFTRCCDLCFGVFVIAWTGTRMYYMPFVMLPKMWTLPDYCGGVILANLCVSTLQVLHVFWSFRIYGIIWKMVTQGTVDDTRSDSEESAMSDDGNGHVNGNGKHHSQTNGFHHKKVN